jgi:hypothetical protein
MTNSERAEFHIQTVLHGLQALMLIVGVATVFMAVGRKDQQIESTESNLNQLQTIVQDLVKAQVEGVTKDSEHDRVLVELKQRIYRLETNSD